MKKLMMILAASALAAVVHAGSLTWSSSGLKTAGEGGVFTTTAASGVIGYLFVGTPDKEAISSAITAKTFTGSGNLASATSSGTGAITKAGIGSYVSQTVSLYEVVFNGATIADSTYYMISSVITQTFGTAGNKTYNFATMLPTSWTAISAVPEPTSMALLIIGAAVFGLRRKIRK